MFYFQTRERNKQKVPTDTLVESTQPEKTPGDQPVRVPGIKPCCIVAPISATPADRSPIETPPEDVSHGTINITADSRVCGVEDGNIDDISIVSSYSSLQSSDLHVIPSESESSTCSKSTSSSVNENVRREPMLSKEQLSEEDFHDILCSPVVEPLCDERMHREVPVVDSPCPEIVQEYGSSVVDSSFESIYGRYHDIVPPLQPYTRPVIPHPQDKD